MANPLDLVLDNRISILESLCARYRQGTCLAYGKFTPLQRMSNNAQSFWALKETKSPCGRSYANRVSKLQHEGRSFLHNYDLKALEDFASRQKQVACEAELELFQVSGPLFMLQ